jgi:hypothetical protein
MGSRFGRSRGVMAATEDRLATWRPASPMATSRALDTGRRRLQGISGVPAPELPRRAERGPHCGDVGWRDVRAVAVKAAAFESLVGKGR